MNPGIYVFGLAAVAMGVVDLVWGALDPAHQPLQAWGDNVPGRQAIAYILGVLLAGGGTALLSPRTARLGAGILASVYLIVAVFWLPRFYTAPHYLGPSPSVYLGVLGGVCQELIIVCAAVFVAANVSSETSGRLRGIANAARVVFGVSAIDFGLVHLTTIQGNLAYVPAWMPFGQAFWVAFTGVAFVLAGIAILTGILDVLTARLLSLMWLVFSAFTLLPGLAAAPHDEGHWGGNAYNILAAASAWILADWLARHKRAAPERQERRASTA
jgi:uncharacterized membrane protein